MILALGIGAALGEPCPGPVMASELSAEIDAASAAYAAFDAAGFEEHATTASALLPCLSEPASPSLAGAVHRMNALGSFLDKDHPATVVHFQSAITTDPRWQLPESLAPGRHPLRLDFEQAVQLRPSPTAPLAPPEFGWLLVDGARTERYPTQRPFLFQHIGTDGAPDLTRHLAPGAALPPYPVLTELTTEVPATGHSPRKALWKASATAAIVGASCYGLAGVAHMRFWDPQTPDDEVRSLAVAANALVVVSAGAGVTALGLGVGAVAAPR